MPVGKEQILAAVDAGGSLYLNLDSLASRMFELEIRSGGAPAVVRVFADDLAEAMEEFQEATGQASRVLRAHEVPVPRLLHSICYQVVTEESAARADFAREGFEVEREVIELTDLSRKAAAEGFMGRAPDDLTSWWETSPYQDVHSGEWTTKTLHLYTLDGKALPPGSSEWRALNAALGGSPGWSFSFVQSEEPRLAAGAQSLSAHLEGEADQEERDDPSPA